MAFFANYCCLHSFLKTYKINVHNFCVTNSFFTTSIKMTLLVGLTRNKFSCNMSLAVTQVCHWHKFPCDTNFPATQDFPCDSGFFAIWVFMEGKFSCHSSFFATQVSLRYEFLSDTSILATRVSLINEFLYKAVEFSTKWKCFTFTYFLSNSFWDIQKSLQW